MPYKQALYQFAKAKVLYCSESTGPILATLLLLCSPALVRAARRHHRLVFGRADLTATSIAQMRNPHIYVPVTPFLYNDEEHYFLCR